MLYLSTSCDDSDFLIKKEKTPKIAYEKLYLPTDETEPKNYKYFLHRWNSKRLIKISISDLVKTEYELPIKHLNLPFLSMHEIPNKGIFCFEYRRGGCVFLIHQDNSIEKLSNRHNLSEGSSTIYFDNFIYIFGGMNKSGQTLISERYNFMQNRWELISSPLASKFNISGFGFNQKIIFHQQASGLLEIYDIKADLYNNLCLPLINGEYKELFRISSSVYLFDDRFNLLEINIEDLYDNSWKILGNVSPCMNLIGRPVLADNSIYFLFLAPTFSLYKFDFATKNNSKVKDFIND